MSLNQPPRQDWYFDTGATSHMAFDAGILSTLSSPTRHSPSFIVVGNGNLLPVTSTGTTHLPCNFDLNNVLVSPDLIKNLISVRRFTTDNNCSVEFDPFGCSVKDLPLGQRSSDVTARDPCTLCSYRHLLSLLEPPPPFGINVLDILVAKLCLD